MGTAGEEPVLAAHHKGADGRQYASIVFYKGAAGFNRPLRKMLPHSTEPDPGPSLPNSFGSTGVQSALPGTTGVQKRSQLPRGFA